MTQASLDGFFNALYNQEVWPIKCAMYDLDENIKDRQEGEKYILQS
jgi:hypothetical protein